MGECIRSLYIKNSVNFDHAWCTQKSLILTAIRRKKCLKAYFTLATTPQVVKRARERPGGEGNYVVLNGGLSAWLHQKNLELNRAWKCIEQYHEIEKGRIQTEIFLRRTDFGKIGVTGLPPLKPNSLDPFLNCPELKCLLYKSHCSNTILKLLNFTSSGPGCNYDYYLIWYDNQTR